MVILRILRRRIVKENIFVKELEIMVVIFDLLYAQPQNGIRYHGGGEYSKSVFKKFVDEDKTNRNIHVCYDFENFIDTWILETINKHQIEKHNVKNSSEIAEVVNNIAKKDTVRFFAGMIYPYSICTFDNNVTAIGTCHGLRMLEKPFDPIALKYVCGFSRVREWFNNKINYAKKYDVNKKMYIEAISNFNIIITDSFHSKYALHSFLGEYVLSKEIIVIYPSEKFIDADLSNVKDDDYILMISADRWLKNAYRGLTAIDELYQNNMILNLKTKVYGNYPKHLRNQLTCKDKFEFYDYVEPEELENAYARCSLFLYPSLNEGFGLPPMESMKYGKTCIISSICSLPEVYGDSVYYVNPYDINEMKARILEAYDRKKDISIIEERLKYLRNIQQAHNARLINTIGGENDCKNT